MGQKEKIMLNPKKLGFAAAILSAAVMLITTFLSITNGYGTEWLKMMQSIYPGYEISPLGCIVGAVYGFFDGFIFFYLFGKLYNKL